MRDFVEPWAQEAIYLDNEAYFTELLENIKSAQTNIDVEMYIFKSDELGKKVVDALILAAKRGVHVRVLIDSVGSATSTDQLEEWFRNTPVQLRFYHRFFNRGVLNTFTRLNRRNHRKTWIFDNQYAHVGSVNITKVHLPRSLGGDGWRDATLCVSGDSVSVLRDSFEVAWTKPSIVPGRGRRSQAREILSVREGHDGDLIHMNDSPKRRHSLRIENKIRLLGAKKRIWFANPYFAPHRDMVQALLAAGHRGVDVRIVVPKKSDVFFMPILSFSYYKALLEAGVKIYRYLPSMLHAKIRIIDDHLVLGSSSLDYRSLLYNLESDVVVTHKVNQDKLMCEVESYIKESEIVTLDEINKAPFLIKVLARIILLFKYWV